MGEPPAEARGRARVMWTRLAAADRIAATAMAAIVAPLRSRARRHPVPRRDALIDAARAWRERVPTFGRIMLDVKQARDGLCICELRAGAAKGRMEEWAPGASEVVVALFWVRLEASRQRRFHFSSTPLATASLHALARRFERGGGVDGDVLVDLALLAAAADPLAPAYVEFDVPTGAGAWVGEMVEMPDGAGGHPRVLAARTFLAPGQMAAQPGDGRRLLGSGRGHLIPPAPIRSPGLTRLLAPGA